MNQELKQKLAEKFLTWPLPDTVCADPCANTFGQSQRTDTNLLTYEEAMQMVEHLFDDYVAKHEALRSATHSVLSDWYCDLIGPSIQNTFRTNRDVLAHIEHLKECYDQHD